MYEATLEINHNSPYADITRDNNMRAEMWCNKYCDMLHLTGPDINDAMNTVKNAVGISNIAHKNEEVVLITDSCLLKSQNELLEEYLQPYHCISLPPLTYDHGTLLTRIISLEEDNLTNIYHDINKSHDVTIKAKREIKAVAPDVPLLMLDSMIPDLTDKQQEALEIALEQGYYEIPRETSTEAVSEQVGVSRRTVEEHLRRAENKVIKGIIEYIV